MAVFEQGDRLMPDTSRADNIRDRLIMNAMRSTVAPPAPEPVMQDADDPFIPGTNIRLSQLQAMNQERAMQQAMAEQQRLLGNTGALNAASIQLPQAPAIRPAAPAVPASSLPSGFLSIDLLTWEVVADNGQRFPILTQEEARSVVAYCYNIMMRAINMQTQQLREILGLPEPTLPATTGIPQMRQLPQEAPKSGTATGVEGLPEVPRKQTRRKRVPAEPKGL